MRPALFKINWSGLEMRLSLFAGPESQALPRFG
jgi:hypothetical protein